MSGDQVASGCEWCIFHTDEAQRSEYIIHGPAEDSLIIKNIRPTEICRIDYSITQVGSVWVAGSD